MNETTTTEATSLPTATTTKPGYRTTEFWLSLAATALTVLFASGALTSSASLAIAGMAATVLTALGYKVSRTLVKIAGLLLMIGFGAQSMACATVKADAAAAKTAIVECAKADAAPILLLAGQLAAQALIAQLDQGSIDWPAVEEAAATQGKVVGGCALTRFVAALSQAPRSDTAARALVAPPDPAADGRAAIARLSARFDGVTWQ